MRLWLASFYLQVFQIVKGISVSGCDRNAVGIQYRSVIPDSSLTASSYYDSRYAPQLGRLHSSLGWAPSTVYNEKDYLQIDLGRLIEVCGVATQGGRYYNEWVTHYKLRFSKYGAFWNTYQENGTEKIFQGNSDMSTVEIRCLQNLQSARYIQFVPTAYHKHKTMRVEVFTSYLDGPDIVPHQRSLKLTWRIMDNIPVVSYLMEFKNKSRIESLILPNDTMEYNLTNLQPYTEYSVRLRGMLTSDGAGVWSNWINAKTIAAAAPTCSPVLLSAQATSSTSVRVTWKPPPDNECRNGKLKGYRIRCSLSGTENLETFTVKNVNASTYDITGLQRYTRYLFSVSAYTVANGPWSNQLTNRTAEDAPSCSPDIKSIHPLTSVSARVEWSLLPSTHCRRNGIIRGYKIAYRKVDEDELYWSTDSNPNSTSIVVSGLKKFTNYSFQVLAYTVKDGNLSKAAFGRTQEDVPECSPVITNIQAISSMSVSMAWQQDPTCLNGILRGYIIQYSLLDNSTVQSINITDDRLSTSRNVSGLRKYTNYSFGILAYTIGKGPLSNASFIRTAEDAPSCSPSLLSAQTSSSTSVRLTWKPPPDNECRNGILRGYCIGYRSAPEIGSYNITLVDPLTTTYHVTGLHKYTWYTFTVLVYTVANGPRSNTLVNRTAEDAPECSPTLISVLNVSSTSISVIWTPLPHGRCRNGVLRGYKMFCNNTSTGESLVMQISDSDTTTVNVTGLSKYTEYSFRILGYTVKDGPLSNKMTRKTSEDAPDCSPKLNSTEVLSSTRIRVRWNGLARLPCINGIVRGYKIKYYHNGGDINTFHISNIDATTADIVGLKKFTWYTFLIWAYTVKDGPLSKEYLSARTKADAPSAPVNVNCTLLPVNGSLGPRVEIRWDEPREKNGVIHKYSLVYFHNKDNATEKKDEIIPDGGGQRTYLHTIDVIGETTFSFKVNAYTIKDGPYQDGEDLVVPAYPPSTAPSNISRREINDTSFLLQWSPIPRQKSNGHVTKYEVRWIFLSRGRKHRVKRSVVDNTKNDTTNDLQYAITGLLSCAQYSISVRGYTSAGSGPYSTPISVITSQPYSPFGVLVKQTGTTSVLLWWKKPANVVEKIDKYMIEYRGYKTYTKFKTGRNVKTIDGTEHRITNLVPATHYEFWVSAFTPCGKSPRSTSAKTETRVTNPLSPRIEKIQQYHETGVSVNVTLFPASQINGPISAYQVIVEFLKENVTRFDHRLLSNYEQNTYSYPIAEKNNVDYYITAEVQGDWLKSSRQLRIGDNLTYSKFRNMPLKKGARYHIYQRTVAKNTTKMLYSKEALVANISVASADVVEETKALIRNTSGSGTVVGLVVGLMLLIILVTFVAYFILKRQRNVKKEEIKNISLPLVAIKSQQQNSSNDQGLAHEEKENVIKPIHVTKFAEYIAATRKDEFSELLNQFKVVPGTHVFSCIAAKKAVNKVKNRYGNIVAYDHSRVKLQRINEDEDSDYINASFMHGYDGTHRTYIASQGPLPDTTNDFWRMIWEQHTTCIVMLTNLIELGKRKCHQYWPENSEQYADITITNHKTEVFADYHIRTFLLTKGTHDKISRRLLLFHFTAWPDKGVPKNATALLSFRRKVREMSKWANTGPTVIHCSAGVGRTGTYMIIDAMLEQVESKKTIDIYNYLNVLRKDRPYMVQTSEQYVFIHMALFEEITCGNTEIDASNLENVMQNLSSVDNEETLSGYAIEFQRLEFIASYGVKNECGVGQEEENAKKNRYKNIVPVNQCRVVLSSDDSNQGDYINATFIDTYRERNAFIMTQAPMENTIADFWRMVMDYEIGTIVMLNDFQEGDEIFPVYWQQEEPITYDGIEVCLSKTEEYDDILLRTFRVSYESTQRSVQHLQHTAWDDNSVPNSSQGLLDLFEKVWKSQQKCSNNPVVVHCSNGVGRSGTFCAIASCLERVKQEQVLDVFQTVKNIRVNRPGAVETLSQYEYCYSTLKQYLDSFIDYANFTGI